MRKPSFLAFFSTSTSAITSILSLAAAIILAPAVAPSALAAGCASPATFPGWLQGFAKISPVTLTANAARSLALTGAPVSLAGAVAWIGGLPVVFVPLCVWRYRRMS